MSPSHAPHPHRPQALLATVASRRQVHAAFQFFHLHQQLFCQWHEQLAQIAAPTFAESPRAHALSQLFHSLGLHNIHTDSVGNLCATLPASQPTTLPAHQPATLPDTSPQPRNALLISAHMDTVFPADTELLLRRDGNRILIPGASDNAAGLTAMLAIAACFQATGMAPACDLHFVATVCEEGDGDLRGIRALFHSPLGSTIRTAILLDGAGATTAVTQALGSKRFQIQITGPGGHSWSDSHRPNPIVALAHAIATFRQQPLPASPATTVNFATVHGGTSVNSLPHSVLCKVDIRSLAQDELLRQEVRLHRAVEDAVLSLSANQPDPNHRLHLRILQTGARPAAELPATSPLAQAIRTVDRHLQIPTHWRTASTDANLPLSLGIPAVTLGGGGAGGAAHTLDEWFDPTNRELALRRILLLTLISAEDLAHPLTTPDTDTEANTNAETDTATPPPADHP